MPDILTSQIEQTVQSAVRREDSASFGVLLWLAQSGEIIAPWWSTTRDMQLRGMSKQSDHFNSAMYMMSSKLSGIPRRVEPRITTIKSHRKQAQFYNDLLHEGIQFGEGWEEFWQLFFHDLWTTDNGAFAEVIGGGDPLGPIEGPAVGLAHLDSARCTRTSNPEFPVVYQDTDGKRYKFHYTRIMFRSQQRSPISEMHGVGLCWLSRAINTSQHLIDIGVFKQEKLGSRPMRSMITGTGITTDQIIEAMMMADESMDNQGLKRFSKTPVIASMSPDLAINLVDFASLPDGFDDRTSTELGMFLIALAGGFPPRWLWPATTTGATTADALYQHISGTGGGATWHINMMRNLLSGPEDGLTASMGKFLPPQLKLVFDYQDDETDRLQADIKAVRSTTRETDIGDGVITIRVAREQALQVGDLTEAQFVELELENGRLTNGDSVLTLFSSKDEDIAPLLDLGFDQPLILSDNDPEAMIIELELAALEAQDQVVNAATPDRKQRAKEALSALGQLKMLYEEIVLEEIVAEEETEEAAETQTEQSASALNEQDETGETEQETESETE